MSKKPLSVNNIIEEEYAIKQGKKRGNAVNLSQSMHVPTLLERGFQRMINRRKEHERRKTIRMTKENKNAMANKYYKQTLGTQKRLKTLRKAGLLHPTVLGRISNNESIDESNNESPAVPVRLTLSARSNSPAATSASAAASARPKSPAAAPARPKSPAAASARLKLPAKSMLPSVNLTKVNMDNNNYVNLSKKAVPSRQYAENHVAKPSLFQSLTRLFKK